MRTGRSLAALGFAAASALLLAAGVGVSLVAHEATPLGLAASGTLTSAALACFAIAGALLTRQPLSTALGLRAPLPPAGRLGLLALGLVALSLCVDAALETSGLRDQSTLGLLDAVVGSASPLELAALAIGIGVAPAIAEELLFRGWLLGALSRPLGWLGAALLTTLLFAALHIDPVHAAGALALGAYLVAVRMESGSTQAAIVCHMANNLAAVGLGASKAPPLMIVVPLAAALATYVTYQLAKRLAARRAEHEDDLQPDATTRPND